MRATFASTHERAFAGCIVTLVNPETKEERVRHAPGYSYQNGNRRYGTAVRRSLTLWDALDRLLREVDGWDGTWKVRTISTPQSILSDLKGRLEGNEGARPLAPEPVMLTHIGRIDMWEGVHAHQPKARARARKRAAK